MVIQLIFVLNVWNEDECSMFEMKFEQNMTSQLFVQKIGFFFSARF